MNYFDDNVNEQKFDNKDMNMSMGEMCCSSEPMIGTCCTPIYECPQERICHRYICYEVPHIMPCNTRIINHHIYKHTFRPEYSTCEENVCENIYGPKCC